MRTKKHILFAALLAVCTLVHAETAVYTVTSYHDIALTDGVAPENALVTFNSTTASGTRITAGNSATLTISGYDDATIRSVTLKMKSNKSAGGGSLEAYLNSTLIASIADASFADDSWNGAYQSGDTWADIEVPFAESFDVPSGGVITIVVNATANSLYVGGCVIDYRAEPIPTHPYTVFLVTGTEEKLDPIKESGVGKGVILPSLEDADMVWHFLGWMESQLAHTDVCPMYYPAGTKYFPKRNMMLYALYCNKTGDESLVQDTLFESGTYALVSAEPYSCMLEGGVKDKKVQSSSVDVYTDAEGLYHIAQEMIPEENRYFIQFTDSTATVQHVQTNKYIGYNVLSHYLQSAESEWQVLHASAHSLLFYHTVPADSYVYALHPNGLGKATYYMDTRMEADSSQVFMLLFAVPDIAPIEALYTTTPRSGVGVPRTEETTSFRVWRIDGTYVMTADSEEAMRSLPQGVYIIQTSHGAEKRVVPGWK